MEKGKPATGGPAVRVHPSLSRGLFDVLLHFCLAAEIGKIRAAVGIGDADVHEAPNAGAPGGVAHARA